MQRIVFSSAELPAHLDDSARFSLWRDLYTTRYGLLDLRRSDDRPFSTQFEFAQFGGVGLGQFKGTVNRVARTRREVAEVPSDQFCLVVNRGDSLMSFTHRGREAALRPGAATLFNDPEPGALLGAAENAWFALVVPRRQLLELVVDAEDSSGRLFDPSLAALRHLRRYLDLLLELDGVGDDPAFLAHVGRTLTDLIALTLGAGRDAAAIAGARGLRAARSQEVLAQLRLGFADPAFSPRDIAVKLGVSSRYVQKLLHDTGASFTERVLELRLQKARAMLADPRRDRLKISDVAYACGFNEASYFNRCFRRRFCASPRQYGRGSGGTVVS